MLLLFIFAFYIRPALLFVFPSKAPSTSTESISELSIVLSSLLTISFLIGIPVLWLRFVDNISLRDIPYHLKLRRSDIKLALLWGFVAFVALMLVVMFASLILKSLQPDIRNPVIEEMAGSLSLLSILFIGVFQSSSEEVFFRGFLLDKLSIRENRNIGIVFTAILFGFAHMAYRLAYQIILPFIIGIIFGYVVTRSKNLLSSILPHVSFNLLSLVIAHYMFSLIL